MVTLYYYRMGLDCDMKLTECTVQLVDGSSDRYQLLIRVHEPGYYVGCIKYADTILGLK